MPTRAATKGEMGIAEDVSALLANNATFVAAATVKPGPVNGPLVADAPEAKVTQAEIKKAVAGAKKISKDAKKASEAKPDGAVPVDDARKFTGKRANFETQRKETAKQQDAVSNAVDAALAKMQGTPEPETEVEEVVAEEPEEVETEEADEPEEATEADEDEYERASAILRLDGWKSKALAKLSQQEVLELAAARSKIRAGVEERLNELATLKKAAVAGQEKPRDAATAQPATGAPSFDVKKATTRIREQWGTAEADMVGEAIQGAIEWVTGMVAAKESALQPLFAHVQHLTEAGARARIASVYPQARKDKEWERVRQQLTKLNPQAFDSLDAMYDEAAEARFGRAQKQSNAVPKERVLAARSRAQADVSSRTRDEEPITADNKVDRVYAALARGDRAEAERIGRS